MTKNENFINNPYFGFRDILFPEDSKLKTKNDEKVIDVSEVKKKVESISGDELSNLIKKNYVSNLAELVSTLIVEVGLDEYFAFSRTGKIGTQGFSIGEDRTVSSINTLVKANIEANCNIFINSEGERELIYGVGLSLFYGPHSFVMLERIKEEQELTEEVIDFIENICSSYNTYMASGERVESLYTIQLKKVLHVFTRVLDYDSEFMKPKISLSGMYQEKEKFIELGLSSLVQNTINNNPDKTNFYVDFAKIVKENIFFSPSLTMGVSCSIIDWGAESFYGQLGEEKEGVFFTSRSCGRDLYICLERPRYYENFLCTKEEEISEEETVFLAEPLRSVIPSPRYFSFPINLETVTNKIWK